MFTYPFGAGRSGLTAESWNGEPRSFFPDSTCQPFKWNLAWRGFFLPAVFTIGRFSIPRGQRGVIGSHCYQQNQAQMKRFCKTLIVRGTDPNGPTVPVHGALTDVFESGHLDGGGFTEERNDAGLQPAWDWGPVQCWIQLEEGPYTLVLMGGDQTDGVLELEGWCWPERSSPDPPALDRQSRRARRYSQPDESCRPFHLGGSRLAGGAGTIQRILDWRVPHGMHQVIAFVSHGDTVPFSGDIQYGLITQASRPDNTYQTYDAYPLPNAVTELSSPNGSINFPRIAPFKFPVMRPKFSHLEGGFYRYIRQAGGNIGSQTILTGWTFDPRED